MGDRTYRAVVGTWRRTSPRFARYLGWLAVDKCLDTCPNIKVPGLEIDHSEFVALKRPVRGIRRHVAPEHLALTESDGPHEMRNLVWCSPERSADEVGQSAEQYNERDQQVGGVNSPTSRAPPLHGSRLDVFRDAQSAPCNLRLSVGTGVARRVVIMDAWIVVPCYNEAERWNSAYWANVLALDGIRVLFVNDGSTDATGALIDVVCSTAGATTARVLTRSANRGKAEAVRAGILDLLSDASRLPGPIGFMDADGAFQGEDISRVVDIQRSNLENFEAVWSSRVALAGRAIDRSIWRHYISRAISTVVCWRDPSIPYDTQSGLKMFSPSQQLLDVLAKPFRTRWMFEPELLARWQASTGRSLVVWEEPLLTWAEVPGSHLRGRELLRVLQEVLAVKRVQASARRVVHRRVNHRSEH